MTSRHQPNMVKMTIRMPGSTYHRWGVGLFRDEKHDGADRERKGADGTDDGPRARIDEMVVVVLGVRFGHQFLPFVSLRSRRPASLGSSVTILNRRPQAPQRLPADWVRRCDKRYRTA